MENRFIQAFRLLVGKPLSGVLIDGTMLLDPAVVSECDHTQRPPLGLTISGVLADGPPVNSVQNERFRASVFPERDGTCDACGGLLCWVTLELHEHGAWYHLLTLHESRLDLMLSALQEVGGYLDKPSWLRDPRLATSAKQ